GTERQRAELMRQIGDAYVGLEDFPRAKQIYADSLELLQKANYRWGIADVLNDLGNVTYQMQQYPESKDCFLQALTTAMAVRAVPVALASVAGIASLLAQSGNQALAFELATFTLQNSITDKQTSYRAEQLLTDLEKQLSSDAIATARERGQNWGIGEVV